MHELGIVFHIIDSLESVGRENQLTQVANVTLEIGEVSGVVDSYLKDCWKWASEKSSLLRGAKLITQEIPAVTSDLWNGGARKGMSVLLRWKYISGGRKRI